MKTTKALALSMIGGWAAIASAQTVNVSLTSPQNGQTVSPGASISWTASFTVSAANNQGLALLVGDLVQDNANPAFLEVPPAGSVPAGMTNFSRPAGITNPGEGGNPTGYVGVQRGTSGHKDLIQFGGAQNTFGVARPPGSGVAENANVVAGVGQSGSQVLASGSFAAPSAGGTYTFELANVVANALQQRNNPPAFSPVVVASVVITSGSISFTVSGGTPCVGDIDGNGSVGLSDLSILLSQFGSTNCPSCSADLDHDGDVDLADLSLLLAHFGTNCP